MEIASNKPQRTQAETRLIMIRIVLLSFILFFNSTSTTYLYSFLPDMMYNFKLIDNKTEAGKYAAALASGFFFGRFVSASIWGFVIDKYGRKTGLMAILGSVSFLTLLFGFSEGYYYALIVRIITGFFNGLSIVGKTLSTEICPNDLKSWSISVTNTIWALGMTLGPFIGSFFYDRIEGMPYLASSAAVAALGVLLMVLSHMYFEETLVRKPAYEKLRDNENETPQIRKSSDGFENLSKLEQLKGILEVPNIAKLIFIFGINTFYAAVLGELIPFWVAAQFQDGGLGFEYKDIKDIYLYLTAPQLVLQIFLYPIIQKGRGDFWLLSVGHWAHIPMFFLVPFARVFWASQDETFMQKFWIILWLFVRNVASFMNFSALQRFTNDAISGEKRGKLNGFQVTFSSCLQVAGPALGGWLLSWSMKNGLGYPFNYHLVFILMCVITGGVLVSIYRLKFADSEKKKLLGEQSAH